MKFNIQSISDIITNSSSEIFCTITSNYADEIRDIFDKLFNYNDDPEMCPAVDIDEDGDVTIELPYDTSSVQEFFKAGIEAILNTKFKNKYSISYE